MRKSEVAAEPIACESFAESEKDAMAALKLTPRGDRSVHAAHWPGRPGCTPEIQFLGPDYSLEWGTTLGSESLEWRRDGQSELKSQTRGYDRTTPPNSGHRKA